MTNASKRPETPPELTEPWEVRRRYNLAFTYIHICYSPAGRSVLGEIVPEVLIASGGTQTEGTVSPNMDRPRPVNNIFIFFLLQFKHSMKNQIYVSIMTT